MTLDISQEFAMCIPVTCKTVGLLAIQRWDLLHMPTIGMFLGANVQRQGSHLRLK